MEDWPIFRSRCPVASALDVIGDKWTLVVLRTIFVGRHRFGELADVAEGISTNILADRLEKLERFGLIQRHAYQDAPVRYEYRLTKRGADLLPVLQSLAIWSVSHIPGRWTPATWFMEASPDAFYPQDRK